MWRETRSVPVVVADWTVGRPIAGRAETAPALGWAGWPVASEKVDDDGIERVRRFAAAWRWLAEVKRRSGQAPAEVDWKCLGKLTYGCVAVRFSPLRLYRATTGG